MLLTETIKKSTAALKQKRMIQEEKQSAQQYVNALKQLEQASGELKRILLSASALQEKGIVDTPLMDAQTREDLKEYLTQCIIGVDELSLTQDRVRALKEKTKAYGDQIQIVWKDAARRYSEGTKGYLSTIAGISDNPTRARQLVDRIEKVVSSPLAQEKVDSFVADVEEAKKMVAAFSLNEEIELFLKKVSERKATVQDLTPGIMQWISEQGLAWKLKIRF